MRELYKITYHQVPRWGKAGISMSGNCMRQLHGRMEFEDAMTAGKKMSRDRRGESNPRKCKAGAEKFEVEEIIMAWFSESESPCWKPVRDKFGQNPGGQVTLAPSYKVQFFCSTEVLIRHPLQTMIDRVQKQASSDIGEIELGQLCLSWRIPKKPYSSNSK